MTNSSLQPSDGSSQSEDGQVINTEIFKGRDALRSDTPETWLPDLAIKPDITFQCEVCREYFSIDNLPSHRSYHKALITLNYSHSQLPTDVRSLSQRRSNILKQLQADAPKENYVHPADVKRIDAAYEVLKNHIEDASGESSLTDQTVDTSLQGLALNCSLDCVYAVSVCSNPNSRWKQNMEDYHVYQDYFGDDRNKCYLAVFDGYHGSVAARRSSQELHDILIHEMAKFDSKIKSTVARNFTESDTARASYERLRPDTTDSIRVNLHQESTEIVEQVINVCYDTYNKTVEDRNGSVKKIKHHQQQHHTTEQIHNAFRKSYLLMDILLSHGQDEMSKVRWSGTSAVTVVVQNVKPNIHDGDSTTLDKELFGSETDSGRTTRSVKPQEVIGLVHIANAGNCRALLVQGGLPYRLTKDHTGKNLKERKRVLAAGGNFSKSDRENLVCGVLPVTRGLGNHGDKRLKDCVIVDPHVTSVPIHRHAQFLILATGGLWEVLSDEEVAHLLVKMLPDEQIPPPREISESLLPLLQRHQGNSSTDVTSGTLLPEQHDPANMSATIDQILHEQRYPANMSATIDQILHERYGQSGMGIVSDGSVKFEPNLVLQKDQMTLQRSNSQQMTPQDQDLRNTDDCDDANSRHTRSQDFTKEPCMLSSNPDFTDSARATKEGRRKELSWAMAEQLTQAAILAGAKDNITVIVVLLPACGI